MVPIASMTRQPHVNVDAIPLYDLPIFKIFAIRSELKPDKGFWAKREEVAEEGVWIRGASDEYMGFSLHQCSINSRHVEIQSVHSNDLLWIPLLTR